MKGLQLQQASHRLWASQGPAIGQGVLAHSAASRQLSKHLREESCSRGPADRRGRGLSGRGAGDLGGRQPGCRWHTQWRPGLLACLLVGWGRIWIVKRQGLRLSSVGRLPLDPPFCGRSSRVPQVTRRPRGTVEGWRRGAARVFPRGASRLFRTEHYLCAGFFFGSGHYLGAPRVGSTGRFSGPADHSQGRRVSGAAPGNFSGPAGAAITACGKGQQS